MCQKFPIVVAALARTRHPVTQALDSVTQTFIDTLVVYPIRGFIVFGTGVWNCRDSGAALPTRAVSIGRPVDFGGMVVSLGLMLFAYSTILSWNYYEYNALEHLAGHTR